ncbi:MAG: FAD:protein FMN transferase [Maritimibacter sp.]
MQKMSTDLTRQALNGPTMGTRWSALFYSPAEFCPEEMRQAMQQAVGEVDQQMSTWKTDSNLMEFNRAPADIWLQLPDHLIRVLGTGLEIGRLSDGAFDIGMGDAVMAWGFGADEANPDRIRDALQATRKPTHDLLEIDPANNRARKHGPVSLDLSGIAKGYGVDRLAETARNHGFDNALLSIDGELRALGLGPDEAPWSVAVEKPDYETREPYAMLELEEGAVATSGDYRHWVNVGAQKLSHTMDPRRGGPLTDAPASVTVIAQTCMEADAFATALMVMGAGEGKALATRLGLNALFLIRDGDDFREETVGPIFEEPADVSAAQL